MKRIQSLESYAHKAAKETLLSWLREGCVHDEYNKALGITWRVNRGEPWFGVWEEYPVVSSDDIDCVWDESDWWISLESQRVHGHKEVGHAILRAGWKTLRGFEHQFGWLRDVCWNENHWTGVDDVVPWMAARQPIPTYSELKELGCTPKVIFDVAIQHKGCIVAAIEIVHKHAVTDKKRALLHQFGCPVYVVRADWILSQVRQPDHLVVTEVINRNPQHAVEYSRRGRTEVW